MHPIGSDGGHVIPILIEFAGFFTVYLYGCFVYEDIFLWVAFLGG